MASTYKHGVYVAEQATSLVAPVKATAGLQVIFGTAPVNMLPDPSAAVNTPLLAHSYAEAVQAVGYVPDFKRYTLCESISANFSVVGASPLILVNVLDPDKHSAAFDEVNTDVIDGVAELPVDGVLPGDLVVKNGDAALELGEDYSAIFQNDGTLKIVLIEGGAGDGAASLAVSGKRLDPDLVTAADIIGGVDVATGRETGLEVLRQVYPRFGMTPGILLAPRWSRDAGVTAALQAKTREINGVFRAVCIVDIDSSSAGARKYADVKVQKERQTATSENCFAIWPYAQVGETVYSGSALAAALTVYTDAQHDDIPYWPVSNETISISGACLEDGTEVLLDQDQANTVNSYGAATFLNMNGYRLWGNSTCCYPGSTDPKDRWFAVRRFMSWAANTFILTYFQKVDAPMNKHLIEAIVDSENIRGNSFVARDICARYEIVYIPDENPVTDLIDGKITFHQYITPFVPAEKITNIIEFDPNALQEKLSA